MNKKILIAGLFVSIILLVPINSAYGIIGLSMKNNTESNYINPMSDGTVVRSIVIDYDGSTEEYTTTVDNSLSGKNYDFDVEDPEENNDGRPIYFYINNIYTGQWVPFEVGGLNENFSPYYNLTLPLGPDIVLAGTPPSFGTLLEASDQSEDWGNFSMGYAIVYCYDPIDYGEYDWSTDCIWQENDTFPNSAYNSIDTVLNGTAPAENTYYSWGGCKAPTWTSVKTYDALNGGLWDPDNDAIIFDTNNNSIYDLGYNNPPFIPSNPSPQNDSIDIPIDINLSWIGGDPDIEDTVTYDVYFGISSPPPIVSPGQSATEYNPGTLNCGTMYYWQIVSWDNHASSTSGPEWVFNTKEENNPPDAPIINGPTSGKTGETYSYSFVSVDPDGDDVYYEIDWGDGQVDPWDGPHQSNKKITRNHTWSSQGTFTIMTRAKDVYNAIGDYGTLEITMPRNKMVNRPFLQFLQSHPNLFPLLQKLLQL